MYPQNSKYSVHPFINHSRKVIFWWSAKCGCTTVKSIMLQSMVFDHVGQYMVADEDSVLSSMDRLIKNKNANDGGELDRLVSDFLSKNYILNYHPKIAGPSEFVGLRFASQFRNVAFFRDPLKRFVSGFVDKHIDGFFSSIFSGSFLEAARDIDQLEPHHFLPQTSGAHLPGLVYDRAFDIESIDYGYLSELLGMRVKPRLMHRVREFSGECPEGLENMGYDRLVEMKRSARMPNYHCFYGEESSRLVSDYYRDDIELMRRLLPREAS